MEKAFTKRKIFKVLISLKKKKKKSSTHVETSYQSQGGNLLKEVHLMWESLQGQDYSQTEILGLNSPEI